MRYTERLLPKGWKWVRLGDHVLKIGSGLTPLGGQAIYVSEGVPLIRSQNVHMNRFTSEGLAYISPEQDETMKESRVQLDDVLLNITGASIGRVCVVPNEFTPANVNQHVSIIRSDGSFDSWFMSFFLSSAAFQKYILDAQAGATRQALTKGLIESFVVPLPPLSEQHRIAAVLRDQMAAVEKARTAAHARLRAVMALPASFLRQVFPKPGQSLPTDWQWVNLRDIAALLPSRSITSNGDFHVQAVTTACLTESGFNPDGVKQARMNSWDVQDCLISAGEILIARSNTPELVGRACLYDGIPEGVVASDLTIRIKTANSLLPSFLSRYLSALFINGYWRD
jgi:type I restriction enzyme S subunit